MNFKLFEKKGQGSIEYLLLLAAAVVVVAVVISFMIGTIGPVQDSGGKQTLEFTCITLDSNTPTCGCYLCDKTKNGYDQTLKEMIIPKNDSCSELAEAISNPLIDNTSIRCPANWSP